MHGGVGFGGEKDREHSELQLQSEGAARVREGVDIGQKYNSNNA